MIASVRKQIQVHERNKSLQVNIFPFFLLLNCVKKESGGANSLPIKIY